MRIGGTELYCRELSDALNQRGWQSVLAFEGNANVDVVTYLQSPNVTLETVPSMTSGGITTLVSLHRLIRIYRPEILHLHYTGFVTPFPWLARLSGVRKVFLTNHASYPEGYRPRRTPEPKRTLAKMINAPVCGVVCPSGFGRRCLTETGILSEQKYKLIYNGTQLEQLANAHDRSKSFRTLYQIPSDRVVVTQVGQLIPEKGIEDLLSAFQQAAQIDDRLHLVLVGEGPMRRQYENMVADWKLSNRVTFTGLVDNTAAAGVYEACDMFCLVSRWEELFGFVLVEAMTRSKPIVATRVGGIPEIVVDSETGYLVDRGDTHGIASRIVEFSEQQQLREKMGEAGRMRAAKLFDVKANVLDVIKFLGIN